MKLRYLLLGAAAAAALSLEAGISDTPPRDGIRQPRDQPRLSYRTVDFSADDDRVLLARMVFGEARNCSREERIAVAYTALNRARDGKAWNGSTVRAALLTPLQYSCFNAGDPNLPKLRDPEASEPAAFLECLEVAEGVLAGWYADPTGGATHYINPRSANPSWAARLEKIGRIPAGGGRSRHEFYREQ